MDAPVAMAKKTGAKTPNLFFPTFDQSFLAQHTGQITVDPKVAIVELVANAWDAGADLVEITWPTAKGEVLAVADDGAGMTREEFKNRWSTLSYSRRTHQGPFADTPVGRTDRKRQAFGRNGVGRHAMFCFADEYEVTTSKGGNTATFRVRRGVTAPFEFELTGEVPSSATGTVLRATATSKFLEPEQVRELIGSRFVADPSFSIRVNGHAVLLTDLEHLCTRTEVEVEGHGVVVVRRYDAESSAKTSKHSGIAWWVSNRLVGTPSWDGYDGPLLDARTATAKRYTYVIEANFLVTEVKADWSGFRPSPRLDATRKVVSDHIAQDLRGLMHEVRSSRKRTALEGSKGEIQKLSPPAQEAIATFADEVQVRCPTISDRDINNMVGLLATLEKARSKYSLLEQLAQLKAHDIDSLEKILSEWTIKDMKCVLGELQHRLALIERLEGLVDDHTTDELHELQPIFERGLWIFGPQFESIAFTSNQTLAAVVEKFFGSAALTTPKRRPDFVALPEASIGVYSSDEFDKNHEVSGFSEIVIVELKKGGFRIGSKEKAQAMDYARELRTSGKVGMRTKITAHVLGSEIDSVIEPPGIEGETTVLPRAYVSVLRQAHARTFGLLRKISSSKKWETTDKDLAEVLDSIGTPLFDLSEGHA